MIAGTSALADEAQRLCADERIRAVVWRHCPHLARDATLSTFNTAIHPHDQMLGHSLQHHGDANAAVSQYFNVALQQYNAAQQIRLATRPGGSEVPERFLDFACGYGRLLRFLCHSLDPRTIWAAEIQSDAVVYVAETFGVHGRRSPADPGEFEPTERFDFIWVASLFSHLPESLFHRWLDRLMGLLRPGGVLAFSVHDRALLPESLELPESGILYGGGSEIPELDSGIYGTTYVSEAFVQAAIEASAGASHPYYRLRKALAHEQDIYVVPRDRDHDLSGLDAFRRGPWGWADERSVGADREVYLRGWAASLDDGALDTIEVRVNGQRFDCPTGGERPDVAAAFNDERLLPSGWEFRYPLGQDEPEVAVEVTARTNRDERALIFAGILADPEWTETPQPSGRWLRRWLSRLRRSPA